MFRIDLKAFLKSYPAKTLIVAFGISSTLSYFLYSLSELKKAKDIEDSYTFVQQGKDLIAKNKIAKQLIGLPIEYIITKKKSDQHMVVDDKVMVSIPFMGLYQQGTAEFYGCKTGEKWTLKRVEIQLSKTHADKKLVVYYDKKDPHFLSETL